MAITLRLTDEQAEDLKALIMVASRGYEKNVGISDKASEELPDIHQQRVKAERVAQAIEAQLEHGGEDPVMEVVEQFTKEAVGWVEDEIWGKAQCSEAELASELYRLLGMPSVAEAIIVEHSGSDCDEEDQHHEYYILSWEERYRLYREKHSGKPSK